MSFRFLLWSIKAGLVLLFLPVTGSATIVSYYLDQANIPDPTSLGDGVNYAQVTIDDEGTMGDINFNVQLLSPLSDIAGLNFGIQKFGFNSKLDTSGITSANFISLPAGWQLDAPPGTVTNDGFGDFDIVISDGGTNRLSNFSFSITGIDGDIIDDYLEGSLKSNKQIPAQGSVFFVAHVAGFDDPGGTATSGFFGGSTPVPLPPALLLLLSSLVALVKFRGKCRNLTESSVI